MERKFAPAIKAALQACGVINIGNVRPPLIAVDNDAPDKVPIYANKIAFACYWQHYQLPPKSALTNSRSQS